MPFKDISYLELWQPFCSAEQNHLCNCGKRCCEEQVRENIFHLDKLLRRKYRLKLFLIKSSGSPFVPRSGAICAILVEGVMRNNFVKLYSVKLF